MVIQTNEREFKGKTLQEYLNWKYPTKEDKEGVREINAREIIKKTIKSEDIDLTDFPDLDKVRQEYQKFPSWLIKPSCDILIDMAMRQVIEQC